MSKRSPLLPIFLIVLVDVLGFTIVIPLLGFYSERFGASAFVATSVVSVYAVCSLISTPIIGKLSDRFGRKPLLLVSQAGTCVGFIILGSASALWMVFLGRTLDGITAGNLSIAQAYISDNTPPEDRAKAFGVIGVAFGFGFMFGPGLGGWLETYENVAGMHPAFLVAACSSGLSILATATLLSAEKPPQLDEQAGPGGRRPGAFDFATYSEYFRRPELRSLYVQFFLFTLAFSAFFSGFALFAERRFDWTAREVGYLFTYTGFLGIILQGGVLGRIVKRYGETRLTIISLALAVVSYLFVGLLPKHGLALLLVAAALASVANGILRPVLTSRITRVVGRHEQGVALGISGSLSSIAMALGPPSGGLMLSQMYKTADGWEPWIWTFAWALIPTAFVAIGLVVAIAKSGVAERPAGAAEAGELPSGP